jgi:DNA-binding NarL/FixJ family response regulator
MSPKYKSSKILFIDDDPGSVAGFVDYLNDEGFSNVVKLTSIKSFSEVVAQDAALVFLDIGGVASNLDPDKEGTAVLDYLRKHAPWTRVVVLSGATFDAARSPALASADQCCTKGSLSLADILEITETQLEAGHAPEHRNARIMRVLQDEISNVPLSPRTRKKVLKTIDKAVVNEGSPSFDWQKSVDAVRKQLKTVGELAALLQHFV